MQVKNNTITTPTSFNYDTHVKELNERFGKLVRQLGVNTAVGSVRRNFEVDFAYALREIQLSPPYLQGKMFDRASSIVSALISHLKANKKE